MLGEHTEAARILARTGTGGAAAEDDPGSVADALQRLIDAPPAPDPEAVADYAWPALAERYEQLIEEACGGPRPRSLMARILIISFSAGR